jgi:hypothetical protein
MQWEMETMAGYNTRSWTEYRTAVYAQFNTKYKQDTAYKALTEIRYNGNIQDNVT